jgi:hypothetical protein
MAKAKSKKRKLWVSMPKIKWLKRKIADKESSKEAEILINNCEDV